MREWTDPPEILVPDELRTAVGGHPLIAETLVRRGIVDPQAARAFLDPDLYCPALPSALPHLDRAAERLEEAVRRSEPICVWGDFDVDGQTATTLLVSTLLDLGGVVRYYIPNRQRESHGVHLPSLQRLIAEGARLILTCDTGIGAHEAVAYARSQGVDVVVTDHHDPPADLDPLLTVAHAAVNPKMLPVDHPLRELPGVGVAFQLAQALYQRAGRPAAADGLLDLVALGIVADVATLVADTRYLLQRGLVVLRRTPRLGLQVMMEMAGINLALLSEEQIGFGLAPRLNALGRLADANVAVELLTTGDRLRARTLVADLEGLNARRKLLTEQVQRAIQEQLDREPALLDEDVLVFSHPTWPAGVIGIVAGQLARQYDRPVLLIATPPGEPGRGSARSVPGCDIMAALVDNGELLLGFGGHPLAAGLSIEPAHIPQLRRGLARSVRRMRGVLAGPPPLQIDGVLPLADLSLPLVEQLERLAPFGQGNPPLTLASRDLTLVSRRAVGRSGAHLVLSVADESGATQKVVAWQAAGLALPEGRFDLAYIVRGSDFRGQRELQVEWVAARPVEEAAPLLVAPPAALRWVDCRQAAQPRAELERLRGEGALLVWSEATARAEVGGRDRRELTPALALAIWSTPPGPVELRAALAAVSPQVVYLFAVDAGLDEPRAFLQRLAGLVKRALNVHDGRVSIVTLAAATAQREATVRLGLAWLVARGHWVLVDDEAGGEGGEGLPAGELRLAPGDGWPDEQLPQLTVELRALLAETAAYRSYFARVDPVVLFAVDRPIRR